MRARAVRSVRRVRAMTRVCSNGQLLLSRADLWFVRCACGHETDPAVSRTQAKRRQREHRYPGPNPADLPPGAAERHARRKRTRLQVLADELTSPASP